ncbi:MAG: hypothetical protein ABJK39_00990 [Hyphomicrobiales bacterium]
MRCSFLSLVALVLVACSNNGELQTNDVLEQSLKIERTFSWSGIGFSGELTLKPDATATLRVSGHGVDEGRWRLQDDTICTTWEKAAQGKTKCAKIYRQLDGSYHIIASSTGVKIGVMRLKVDQE